MKIAFIISSAINLDDTVNISFGNGNKRSAFSSEERFRQTQYSLNSINLIFPDSKKYIFDTSINSDQYRKRLSYFKNLDFVSLNEIDKDKAMLCRTSKSKGFCESLSTMMFLDEKRNELENYDFIIKLSGRYFFSSFDKSKLIEENTNKYLFKKIRKWDWKESWNFPNYLKQPDNKLYYAPTQAYCVGKYSIEKYHNGIKNIYSHYLNESYENAMRIDYECLMYYFVLNNIMRVAYCGRLFYLPNNKNNSLYIVCNIHDRI